MTAGIVLAAGASTRMGRSKALLRHVDGTTTFLTHAIHTLRAGGVSRIVVVGRPGDAVLRAEAERDADLFVENPDPDRGQLSSLLVGLEEAITRWDADAVMVLPVDVPMVPPAAVSRLLERARSTPLPILRAVAGGRHGHPVIFARAVFDELRNADPALGARAVVRADPARVLDLDVEDAGVTVDVDTPDDYRRAFGRPV
jgi:molybdenum cofactor cytidylyltransferase